MTSAPTTKESLPQGTLVAWYGDDFTGSAAVMEVLAFSGLPSVLYLGVPTQQQSSRFRNVRGIGIAGTARSHSPSWMRKHLPAIYKYLKSLRAPVNQYKVCSTLDSSPAIGSIGCAIDIAQDVFDSPWIPLFVAAPVMRRYQAFGHFFAGAPGGVFRLDRHPVMSRHPVTPMTESDVNLHLSLQTNRHTGLVDLEALTCASAALSRLEHERSSGAEIIAIDTVSPADLEIVGGLIWSSRDGGLFVVGSQGIEYALVAHWQSKGFIPHTQAPGGVGEVETIVVVSGSVSATTKEQIEWSLANGFKGIALDAACICRGDSAANNAIDHAIDRALQAIRMKASPIVYTACGPDDPAVIRFRDAVQASGMSAEMANQRIGIALGRIVNETLRQSDLRRAVISGGDTSGHATAQLGIYALTALAPTIPGAALFQAHSEDPQVDGLQLALKGGQMGTRDYFDWIRRGGGHSD